MSISLVLLASIRDLGFPRPLAAIDLVLGPCDARAALLVCGEEGQGDVRAEPALVPSWDGGHGGDRVRPRSADWNAPGLTEVPFLGGSYPQGRETVSQGKTIEVPARGGGNQHGRPLLPRCAIDVVDDLLDSRRGVGGSQV